MPLQGSRASASRTASSESIRKMRTVRTPSSSGPPKGTAVLLNYQGWMGKHTVADFETAYPGAGIKQASLGSISSGAVESELHNLSRALPVSSSLIRR